MSSVLLLRAQEDAARTAGALGARGFEVVFSPVLEIVPTGAAAPPGACDALLATSARGIDCAAFDTSGAPPLHVVGARTAAAARVRGFNVETVAEDADALLADLRAHYSAPVRFLYFAGRDRRDRLEAGLAAAGCHVTVIETYEARAAAALSAQALQALRQNEIAAVLHYSRRSAAIFVALAEAAGLGAALAGVAHIAISAEAAAPLAPVAARVSIAARADEEHMLRLLDAI